MNDVVVLMDLTYYQVRFNGHMYEIYNKNTDHVEVSENALPQAIGTAKAFDTIIKDYVAEGTLNF